MCKINNMSNLVLMNLFMAGSVAIATTTDNPLEYSYQKAESYSNSESESTHIECNQNDASSPLDVTCMSDIFREVDWGPNGPEFFDRQDICNFKFERSGAVYNILSEECGTKDIDY